MNNNDYDLFPFETEFMKEKKLQAKFKREERIALVVCLLLTAFIVYIITL